MSYLLHGVVRADHPLVSGRGEDKVPHQSSSDGSATDAPLGEVEFIEADELAVVARPWTDHQEIGEDDAVQHLDVLVDLVRGGPVLPLRLGTVGPDADAIRSEVLGPDAAEELGRRLDAVEDLVELRLTVALDEDTVQVLFNEDAELRALVSRAGPDADLSERVELGQTVAEHLAARRTELIDSWVQTLGPLVEATTGLASSDEGWEQVAFLVRRDQLQNMDTAVAELTQEVGARARVEYVGPLPIFSFNDIEAAAVPATAPQGSRWGW